ncbi:hypothetical protein M413DRAFT_442098 [Hebeloma cylindrosporum]|uniref:Smr domain-containing protein n=1 Tax=Hebeloma cylindrosporum TaxID=76867 RepID=A0A0C3C995_HEBCY|nr:hypothetical protein M413DRAFT_442098 [Hebeloma cylindrosporum h7]
MQFSPFDQNRGVVASRCAQTLYCLFENKVRKSQPHAKPFLERPSLSKTACRMSVSSILSTRSTGWKIDVRLASLMDSIFAIGFGLGLRFVIDAVSDHDFKITGTLVGLWEGVIMLHFTKKMPKSSDPFIAYGVRLFVDFLCTESVTRLVLVLVWTALGMVLADVTPALWYEVGLRRVWRRFRRDIYTMSQMIPTVAFFPPTRTVRFSPSREPSIITAADADAVPPPSVITTEQTPTTNTVPTTAAPAAREILRRRVPGYFPADFSDTETDLGSVRLGPSPGERTSRRLSVYPGILDFDESVSSRNDLDEENLSSVSGSTERPDASSAVIDTSTIPDMYAEEEPLVDVVAAPVKDEEELRTPKQSAAPYMPPTPSDSAMHFLRHQPSEDPIVVRPSSEFMPQIPDFLEEASTEDWEKIQRQEATEEKPPTPPAKDAVYKLKVPIIPAPVPPQPQLQRTTTPSPEDETKGWDMLDSQFISNPNDNNNATSNNDRQVQTYDIDDDDDDMYGDIAPQYTVFPALGESSATEPPPVHTTDFTSGVFGPDPARTNPWVRPEEKKRMDEEAERQQREGEEAARKKQEEKEEALKKIQEEEAAKRLEEEEKLKEKKAQEKAERLKKEAEDDAIRKKKREEEEEAERKRKEEEAMAERKKKEEEEAAERKRKEEEEKKKEEEKLREREETERKKREKKVAKEKKLIEAAEANRQKEVEEEKKRQEAIAQRLREAKEAAEAEAEAERKRLEEEAEAAAVAAAVAQALAEEEERRKEEEALAKRVKEQQEAEVQRLREEAELEATKAKEEAEAARLKEEAATKAKAAAEAQRVKEEAEAGMEEQDKQIDLPTDELNDDYQQDHEGQTGPTKTHFDEESVITEASARPDNVRDRLGKLLLLRAQMVAEVGNEIADLKDQLQSADGESAAQKEEELRQREKTMRKMQKKEKRKQDEGLGETPRFLDVNHAGDDDNSISLENLTPRNAETKIEEKLEALLKPETKSIVLTIHAGRGKSGAKVKTNVRDTLTRYNLIPYTTNDRSNDRISHIHISEEVFAQWLLDYRAQVTQAEEEEEEGHWSQYIRR